jgi:hypothetical protein
MLVMHIPSKLIVDIKKGFYGYCKIYHAHSRNFLTNVVIAYGSFMVPRCKYCIHSMFLCEAIWAHIGACENHWALIEGPLNVTLI